MAAHPTRALLAFGSILLVCAGCGGQSDAGTAPAADDGAPVEVARQQAPPPVSHFRGLPVAGGVELTWTASPDVRYRIFRREAAEAEKQLTLEQPGKAGEARYLDRTARPRLVYVYWIVPENLWALRGDPSAELTIQAR